MSLPLITLGHLGKAVFPERYEAVDLVRDFRAVLLQSEPGLRVLARLAEMTGWLDSTLPMGPTLTLDSPLTAAFNEGRRSIMRDIAALLEEPVNPEEAITDV